MCCCTHAQARILDLRTRGSGTDCAIDHAATAGISGGSSHLTLHLAK